MPSGAQARPLGVVILSAVELFMAIYMLVIAYQLAHGEVLGVTPRQVLGTLASRAPAPYLALLAILPAALSIGLYLMANWARILALVSCGRSLLGCIIGWVGVLGLYTINAKIPTFVVNYLILRTAFYGWVVIYLLRPGVKRAFREAY